MVHHDTSRIHQKSWLGAECQSHTGQGQWFCIYIDIDIYRETGWQSGVRLCIMSRLPKYLEKKLNVGTVV